VIERMNRLWMNDRQQNEKVPVPVQFRAVFVFRTVGNAIAAKFKHFLIGFFVEHSESNESIASAHPPRTEMGVRKRTHFRSVANQTNRLCINFGLCAASNDCIDVQRAHVKCRPKSAETV
jgi:hypothetical protein